MGFDSLGVPGVPSTSTSSVPSFNTDSLGSIGSGFINGLGLSSLLNGVNQAANAASKPWDKTNSNVVSPFYPYIQIDGSRWNQLFPYQLLVVDTTAAGGNCIVKNTNGSLIDSVTSYQQGTTIISFVPTNNYWSFALPITPQQLNITDQFAINTSATLRGIVEEHNGVKFKLINASGTLGVWPYRSQVSQPPQSPNILQSLFGGTISAVGDLINQVEATINTFTTGHPSSKPFTADPGSGKNDAGPLNSTGYYQAMMLMQFLEQYAEAKKDPKNAGWRLVFDIPKQNTSYVVTPMGFVWQQNVSKPMEIQYQLQFKAWRRINLKATPQNTPAQAYTITPGILQQILNGITQARLTMSSATAVIGAVTSDVNQIFQVISQSALFVKDALGVVAAASDLPSSIAKDFSSAIQEWTFNNQQTALSGVATAAGATAVVAIAAAMNQNNGLTSAAVQNGQLGTNASNLQQTGSVATIFNNPNSNVDYLDQVPVNQLNLTTAQQNKLNEILTNAANLSVSQLKQNTVIIQTLTAQLAGYFGAGSAYYNSIYNFTPPPTRLSPMTIDQFLILDTLYEYIQSMNILTATTQVTDVEIQASLNYVAGLASQSNIPFDIPTSKIIVPVPSNTTIEGIAARYLGDPNRWVEIATLNKLQEPYLDYLGFQLPLLSNAIGRQLVVSSNANLYLGQTVTLIGTGQIQVSRNIISITPLPNEQSYLLSLDGEANLNNFTTANNSYIQAYLPGTVNAMQKIYIPSDLPPGQSQGQVNVTLPETVTNSGDPLAQMSGVDFLLNDSGDLVLDQYGNFQLAYGITNIVQWLRILFSTSFNSWVIHQNFGVGTQPGTSISDLDVQSLYKQINQQINNDPRFSGVTALQIQANPPNLAISIAVSIAGQNGVFPVSFQLSAA